MKIYELIVYPLNLIATMSIPKYSFDKKLTTYFMQYYNMKCNESKLSLLSSFLFVFCILNIKCIMSVAQSSSRCLFVELQPCWLYLMYDGVLLQTDLQTHVSTRDVVTCFQKQTNPTSCPTTCAGPVGAKPMQLHSDRSQVGSNVI